MKNYEKWMKNYNDLSKPIGEGGALTDDLDFSLVFGSYDIKRIITDPDFMRFMRKVEADWDSPCLGCQSASLLYQTSEEIDEFLDNTLSKPTKKLIKAKTKFNKLMKKVHKKWQAEYRACY